MNGKKMYDFRSVVGNEKIIKSLRLAIEHGRVSHACIFEGQRGSGKSLIAKAFAKTLLCEEGKSVPCNNCISCRQFESGNHPDVVYVERGKNDKGTQEIEIKVGTIREKITQDVDIKPYSSRYKVFIIKDADMMNVAAQNAFLKTLEEPPEYAVFLLLAENPSKMLPTVLSRCQRFRTDNIPSDKIKAYLIKNGIAENQASAASLFARGSIGIGMEIGSSEDFSSMRFDAVNRCIRLMEADLIELYRITAEMDVYKDNIYSYLDIVYLLYRDCLVYKSTGSMDRVIQQDMAESITRLSKLTGLKRLIRGCSLISEASDNLRRHGDFQLVIENLFFKLKEK